MTKLLIPTKAGPLARFLGAAARPVGLLVCAAGVGLTTVSVFRMHAGATAAALCGAALAVLGLRIIGRPGGRALRRLAALPAVPSTAGALPDPPEPTTDSSRIVESDETAPRPSLLDPLTGLANQRYLAIFLDQEISRSTRTGQPITVLLIDLDDFEGLNSTEGRDAGDRCIAALGTGIRGLVRDYDLAARYKDDEFAVVLPETDPDAGAETAERILSALSGRALPSRATFSIGVATYPQHGASADDLLSSAHHALNRAKFSGKNTVRSCHELAKAA